MNRKAKTLTAEFIILWRQSSVNAFEGAVFGAFVGPIISLVIAGVIWLLRAGLFAGLPSLGDIVFSMGMGLVEGALLGALLALLECARNPQMCLNPIPTEELEKYR